jgi:hypothetical protein
MPDIRSPIQRGHVVTIIGYDDEENCWIVRNSAGEGWGEQGHFRISYEAFSSEYSFIYPFYGGTGILYVDGVYGNFKPNVPKLSITTPKLFHTYFYGIEFPTVVKRVDSIQRGAPRIFGDITILVDSSNTQTVQFYLDGSLQYIDDSPPNEWTLSTSSGLHTLEIYAHNDEFISKAMIDIHKI